jgi:hypothetical protein
VGEHAAGSTQEFLAGRFPFPQQLTPEQVADGVLSPEGIASELDKAGIGTGVLFAVYAPRTVGIAANEDVIADVKQAPGPLLRARQPARRSLEPGRSGRAASACAPRSASPGWSASSWPTRISTFAWTTRATSRSTRWPASSASPCISTPAAARSRAPPRSSRTPIPAYLEPAIAAYPGAIFILGHLGYDFKNKQPGALETCIDLAGRHPTCTSSPARSAARPPTPTARTSSSPCGASARPASSRRRSTAATARRARALSADYLDSTVAAMRSADYSRDEMAAVLAGNFVRVFGVKEPSL